MKPSLRQVLADSHVSAVAIAILLIWSFDSVLDAFWNPFVNVFSFLATAVAILGLPYIPPQLTVSQRLMLITFCSFLFNAFSCFAAAWLNYRHLVETVDLEINRTGRTGREFALLFLDLDGLKKINDRCGHVVGSQALCRLADVLCICSRKIDTPARFGGDEFALVLPETGQVQANLVSRRVCHSLANDGREPKLSVSVGIAIYPKDGEKVDSLLGAADAALYAMKARKRSPDASTKGKTAGLRHKAAGR